jgi:hypothetical protein
VQYRKQRRIHNEGLGVADELSDDLPAQGLKETPELPHPAVQRGRMKPHHPGEQLREEPLGIAQERALALHATELLQERKRDYLRVREPFERLVASKMGVEELVSVVYEAEEHGYHFFQIGERGGMLRMGHLLLLVVGSLMAPFVLLNHATHI